MTKRQRAFKTLTPPGWLPASGTRVYLPPDDSLARYGKYSIERVFPLARLRPIAC